MPCRRSLRWWRASPEGRSRRSSWVESALSALEAARAGTNAVTHVLAEAARAQAKALYCRK